MAPFQNAADTRVRNRRRARWRQQCGGGVRPESAAGRCRHRAGRRAAGIGAGAASASVRRRRAAGIGAGAVLGRERRRRPGRRAAAACTLEHNVRTMSLFASLRQALERRLGFESHFGIGSPPATASSSLRAAGVPMPSSTSRIRSERSRLVAFPSPLFKRS
jgi:hypothetical protein